MTKLRLRPAPRPTEWIPLALVGIVLLAVGVLIARFQWQADAAKQQGAIFLYAFAMPWLLFGLWLTGSAVVTIRRLFEIGRGSTMFTATIIEVRINYIDGGYGGRQARWVVVARGNWPGDGTTHDFDSDTLRTDVSHRYRPGQTVAIHADQRSGLYRIDLKSVSGTEYAQLQQAVPADGTVRPARQRTVLAPHKAYAMFVPVVVIAGLVIVFGGTFRPFGIIIFVFFGMILGVVRLSQKQEQHLAMHGVTFPVRISKIVHERYVGTAGAPHKDDWSISATGTWPDGHSQIFYGAPALDLGSLVEGDTVWVVGDPATRVYALRLTWP